MIKKTSKIMNEIEKEGIRGFDDGKLYYWVSKRNQEVCINDHPELKAKLDKIVREFFQKTKPH